MSLTGYSYPAKAPLADGSVYACGGRPLGPAEIAERKRIDEDEARQEQKDRQTPRTDLEEVLRQINERMDRQEPMLWSEHRRKTRLEEELRRRQAAKLSAPVPDGAMEWLLHEAGHYVCASANERRLPNYGLSMSEYGHDGDREWQAWAFEEIVLAPWGSSRLLAPPSQRNGAAYSSSGPMPARHLAHAESRIRETQIDVEAWRAVWGEWVLWGRQRPHGDRPWEREN